jgi:hypothetical protein
VERSWPSSPAREGGAGNFPRRPEYNVSTWAAESAAIFFVGGGQEHGGSASPH